MSTSSGHDSDRRAGAGAVSGPDEVRRDILPIPDVPHVGLTTYDAKDPDTSYPPIKDVRPPATAPNVLVILIDDVGFGASSAFGGPCQTPNFEKLASGGLKYNRFHTTALCSPTRQALLTGRNHHSVGMGNITETATAAPGYTSVLPNTKAPLALTLRLNGYSTAQFGKCHEVPVWQTSPAGPFTAWPTGGGGFEYFYGFIGGENNQWDPALYEGTTPIEPPKTPAEGYHLTEDLTDKAINWARQQKALLPDKPFFMYFAPGATHAPHHVPAEWIEKYKGKFAHGWDKQREITFERQKELGVIPPDAVLTPRDEEIPAWDDVDPALKPVLEREMEVYAAFMEHTDHHVGRLLDSLEPVLDDTLVYLIVGDNGASAEGTLQGAFNEMANFNGMADLETPEFLASKLDEFGGENSYGHYAVGWAWAMDSPYQWTKQVASHWGGTRNGTIVHWPKGIEEKGGHRNQFTHVIDLAPTVLEAAGIPAPTIVNGVMQSPYEGTSMLYSFNHAEAADRHITQYFEMFGNRALYSDGWMARTIHVAPWGKPENSLEDDTWQLALIKRIGEGPAIQPRGAQQFERRWRSHALIQAAQLADDPGHGIEMAALPARNVLRGRHPHPAEVAVIHATTPAVHFDDPQIDIRHPLCTDHPRPLARGHAIHLGDLVNADERQQIIIDHRPAHHLAPQWIWTIQYPYRHTGIGAGFH